MYCVLNKLLYHYNSVCVKKGKFKKKEKKGGGIKLQIKKTIFKKSGGGAHKLRQPLGVGKQKPLKWYLKLTICLENKYKRGGIILAVILVDPLCKHPLCFLIIVPYFNQLYLFFKLKQKQKQTKRGQFHQLYGFIWEYKDSKEYLQITCHSMVSASERNREFNTGK